VSLNGTPPSATGRLGEYSFILKRSLPRCVNVTRPDLLLGRLLVDWEHCCDLAENTVEAEDAMPHSDPDDVPGAPPHSPLVDNTLFVSVWNAHGVR